MTLLALGCSGAFAFGWLIPVATFDTWLPALVPVIVAALFASANALRAHRVLALLSESACEATTDGHRFIFVVLNGKLQTFLELGVCSPSDFPMTVIPTATARINE